MKFSFTIILIYLGMIFLSASLFTPYIKFDLKDDRHFLDFRKNPVIEENVIQYGKDAYQSIIPIFITFIPFIIFMFRKNRFTSITLFIFSTLLFF